MNNKPTVIIEDGCLKATINLVQPFTDDNMARLYRDMQALIEMAVRSDDDTPNELEEGQC